MLCMSIPNMLSMFARPLLMSLWKEDGVMKAIRQSYGKMITCIVLLLVSLLIPPSTTSAQSPTDSSMCARSYYTYTHEEMKREPFVASISKRQIKQCLREGKRIQNHHIVFEDYRDAWQEL